MKLLHSIDFEVTLLYGYFTFKVPLYLAIWLRSWRFDWEVGDLIDASDKSTKNAILQSVKIGNMEKLIRPILVNAYNGRKLKNKTIILQ